MPFIGERLGMRTKRQQIASDFYASHIADKGDSILTFTITISRDEDGMFVAECPSIPG
jgi:hypothetical protein